MDICPFHAFTYYTQWFIVFMTCYYPKFMIISSFLFTFSSVTWPSSSPPCRSRASSPCSFVWPECRRTAGCYLHSHRDRSPLEPSISGCGRTSSTLCLSSRLVLHYKVSFRRSFCLCKTMLSSLCLSFLISVPSLWSQWLLKLRLSQTVPWSALQWLFCPITAFLSSEEYGFSLGI